MYIFWGIVNLQICRNVAECPINNTAQCCDEFVLTVNAEYTSVDFSWILGIVTGQSTQNFSGMAQCVHNGEPAPFKIEKEDIDIQSLESLQPSHLDGLKHMQACGVFTDDAWMSLKYTVHRLKEEAGKPAWPSPARHCKSDLIACGGCQHYTCCPLPSTVKMDFCNLCCTLRLHTHACCLHRVYVSAMLAICKHVIWIQCKCLTVAMVSVSNCVHHLCCVERQH